jgi:hypothetical protein
MYRSSGKSKTPEYLRTPYFHTSLGEGNGRDIFSSSRDDLLYIYGKLSDEEKNKNSNLYDVWTTWMTDEDRTLRPTWYNVNTLFANTYEEFITKYPEYERIIGLSGSRSRDRDGSENTQSEVGGSRRSLQKSRLVKRKSRKYKSIKKSKKRSFRKRSGKY